MIAKCISSMVHNNNKQYQLFWGYNNDDDLFVQFSFICHIIMPLPVSNFFFSNDWPFVGKKMKKKKCTEIIYNNIGFSLSFTHIHTHTRAQTFDHSNNVTNFVKMQKKIEEGKKWPLLLNDYQHLDMHSKWVQFHHWKWKMTGQTAKKGQKDQVDGGKVR